MLGAKYPSSLLLFPPGYILIPWSVRPTRVDKGSVVPARHSTTPDTLSLTPPPSSSVAMATVSVMLLRQLDEDERGVAGGCGLVEVM